MGYKLTTQDCYIFVNREWKLYDKRMPLCGVLADKLIFTEPQKFHAFHGTHHCVYKLSASEP